jgi:hypothetical protein
VDVARTESWSNPFFDRSRGGLHGVSVGRGGRDMSIAVEILVRAFQIAAQRPAARTVSLTFVGTDYASTSPQQTIAPVAEQFGAASLVREFPARVQYCDALRLLLDSHFTLILGSDDASYQPSKAFPYLMTGRPFVAVLHESSPAVHALSQAGTGAVATFNAGSDRQAVAEELAGDLEWVFSKAGQTLTLPEALRESIGSRELTRQQCQAFDAAIHHAAPQGIPCTE